MFVTGRATKSRVGRDFLDFLSAPRGAAFCHQLAPSSGKNDLTTTAYDCCLMKFYLPCAGKLFASATSESKCYTERPATTTTIKPAIITRTKYRYVRRTTKSTE